MDSVLPRVPEDSETSAWQDRIKKLLEDVSYKHKESVRQVRGWLKECDGCMERHLFFQRLLKERLRENLDRDSSMNILVALHEGLMVTAKLTDKALRCHWETLLHEEAAVRCYEDDWNLGSVATGSTSLRAQVTDIQNNRENGPLKFQLLLPLIHKPQTIGKTSQQCFSSSGSNYMPHNADFILDCPALNSDAYHLKTRSCRYLKDMLGMILPNTGQSIDRILLEIPSKNCVESMNVDEKDSCRELNGFHSSDSVEIPSERIYDFFVASTAFYVFHRAYNVLNTYCVNGKGLSQADVYILALACINMATKLEFRNISATRLLQCAQCKYNESVDVAAKSAVPTDTRPSTVSNTKLPPLMSKKRAAQILPREKSGQEEESGSGCEKIDDIEPFQSQTESNIGDMLSSLASSLDPLRKVQSRLSDGPSSPPGDSSVDSCLLPPPLPTIHNSEHDEECREGVKHCLFSRHFLGVYERFVLEDVLGFTYVHFPLPIRPIIAWVSNGNITREVASKTLLFLNSPYFLLLDIDRLLGCCWKESYHHKNIHPRLKALWISEDAIGLACLLLVISQSIETSSEKQQIDEQLQSMLLPLSSVAVVSEVLSLYCSPHLAVEGRRDFNTSREDVSINTGVSSWPYAKHLPRAAFMAQKISNPVAWNATDIVIAPLVELACAYSVAAILPSCKSYNLLVTGIPETKEAAQDIFENLRSLSGFAELWRCGSVSLVNFHSLGKVEGAAQSMNRRCFKSCGGNSLCFEIIVGDEITKCSQVAPFLANKSFDVDQSAGIFTHSLSEKDVERLCEPFGEVKEVKCEEDYAFVKFSKKYEAENAMRTLNRCPPSQCEVDNSCMEMVRLRFSKNNPDFGAIMRMKCYTDQLPKLFVRDYPLNAKEDYIRQQFERFGVLAEVVRKGNFSFVKYYSRAAADAAIRGLRNKLTVRFASSGKDRQREERRGADMHQLNRSTGSYYGYDRDKLSGQRRHMSENIPRQAMTSDSRKLVNSNRDKRHDSGGDGGNLKRARTASYSSSDLLTSVPEPDASKVEAHKSHSSSSAPGKSKRQESDLEVTGASASSSEKASDVVSSIISSIQSEKLDEAASHSQNTKTIIKIKGTADTKEGMSTVSGQAMTSESIKLVNSNRDKRHDSGGDGGNLKRARTASYSSSDLMTSVPEPDASKVEAHKSHSSSSAPGKSKRQESDLEVTGASASSSEKASDVVSSIISSIQSEKLDEAASHSQNTKTIIKIKETANIIDDQLIESPSSLTSIKSGKRPRQLLYSVPKRSLDVKQRDNDRNKDFPHHRHASCTSPRLNIKSDPKQSNGFRHKRDTSRRNSRRF